jgi:hypothetical protein
LTFRKKTKVGDEMLDDEDCKLRCCIICSFVLTGSVQWTRNGQFLGFSRLRTHSQNNHRTLVSCSISSSFPSPYTLPFSNVVLKCSC